MSFDDLAYSGFGASDAKTHVAVSCPDCKHVVSVPTARVVVSTIGGLRSVRCPDCNRFIPFEDEKDSKRDAEGSGSGSGSGVPFSGAPNNEMLRALFETLSVAGPEFIDFPANNNMAEMMRAQRGVNIDDLINSLLQSSSHNAPPTSEDFVKKLKAEPITLRDFIQVVVTIDGLKRELIATVSDGFGLRIADYHNIKTGDGIQLQCSGRLSVCDPIEGAGGPISNQSVLNDSFVLMKRGKIAFVEKARVATKLGARGLLVVQSDDVWPYQMTDATKSGTALVLPCIMISAKDGAVVQAVLNGTYTDVKTDHKQIAAAADKPTSAGGGGGGGSTAPTAATALVNPQSAAALAVVAMIAAASQAPSAAAAAATSGSGSGSGSDSGSGGNSLASTAPPPAATSLGDTKSSPDPTPTPTATSTPAPAPALTTATASAVGTPNTTSYAQYSLTADVATNAADSKLSAPAPAAAATSATAAVTTPSGAAAASVNKAVSPAQTQIRVFTRERKLACPVCREDYQPGSSVAVKLPCNHFFCDGCIRPWLDKRNTCPLCRYELPTDKPKPKKPSNTPPPENPAVLQLRDAMFN